MRQLVLALIFGALSGTLVAQESNSERDSESPNILVILMDDVGWSDLGVYGSEIPTPNLDSIAAEGIQLTNFHTATMCAPTRAMLMTGIDHHRVGIGTLPELTWGDELPPEGYEGQLSEDTVTIAELLQDNGYQTYFAGKWHLGYTPESNPTQRGFDRSFAMMGSGAGHFNDRQGMWAREPLATYTRDGQSVESLEEDFYSTNAYTDEIIGYLEGRDPDEPFFAYLAFTAAHFPLQAPDPWLKKWRGAYDAGYEVVRKQRFDRQAKSLGDYVNLPDSPRELESMVTPWDSLDDAQKALQARQMEIYAAMIDNMDYNSGRLFDYLKRTGEWENTIVFVLSDNGSDPTPDAGPFEDWAKQFDQSLKNRGRRNSYALYGPGWAQVSSTPWRHFKHYTSVGGVRVPALISDNRKEAVEPGSKISDAFVFVSDLAATILDYAGVPHPVDTYQGRSVLSIEGVSARPLIEGAVESIHSDDYVQGWEMRGVRAIQKGPWRATWFPIPRGDAEWHLFNIADDPAEKIDLRGEHPEQLAEMIELWEEYAEQNGVSLTFLP